MISKKGRKNIRCHQNPNYTLDLCFKFKIITHTRALLDITKPRYKGRIAHWIISCYKPIAIIATTESLTGVRTNFHLNAKYTNFGKKMIGKYA